MYCPECGNEQHCPCDHCRAEHQREIVWEWDKTGEIISCGHCGYSAHADQWELEAMRQSEEG